MAIRCSSSDVITSNIACGGREGGREGGEGGREGKVVWTRIKSLQKALRKARQHNTTDKQCNTTTLALLVVGFQPTALVSP